MRKTTRRYDKYKDSNIEWLGEIPEHWNVNRLKEIISGSLTYGANETATDSNPQHPRFIRITDFSENEQLRDETFKSLAPEVAQKFLLKEGDILFARSGATVGKTFHFKNYKGKACYAGYLIKARPNSKKVTSDFLSYYTKSSFYNTWKSQALIKATIENISAEKYGFFLFVPLPPITEQKAIALYLDTKTAQIDRKIDLLTQKAQRYEELKRSLINETVTGRRRIDNGELIIDNGGSEIDNGELIMENDGGENCQLSTVNYPLYKAVNYPLYKDSAIEWIGEIPEHWKIEKIKRLTSVKRGASPRPIDDPKYFDDLNGEYGWVRIEDVTKSSKYLLETKEKLSTLGVTKSVKMKPGDIFLSIAGSVGKPIISKISCCIHDGFVYFVGLKQDVEFMFYIFNCKNIFSGLGKIGTQLNLNTEIVGGISIPLPPIEEQETIAHYLDTKTTHIDQIIQTINTQIEKLKELRKTLINDVVTGKIKIIDNGE